MKISVIVTVYNLEKYVAAALASVFEQSRLPDEIIVIDDCSIDDSANILQSCGDKIKYFRMPQNGGVMLAFIRGIEEATGDILAFLDGDDIWLPQKLAEIEKAFLENENRILVTHDYECIDADGENRPYLNVRTHYNTAEIVQAANGDLSRMNELLRNSILCYKGVWLGSAFCLRSKDFDVAKFKELMLSLPDAKLAYQDHPAAAFIILENKAKEVYFINQILFQYRLFGFNSSGVSVNLESALKTLSKSRANLVRTAHLVSQHPELIEENQRQAMMLLNIEYLRQLYTKKYRRALQSFVKLFFNLWNRREAVKESQRLFGVLLFGPEKFLNLKSKKIR